jgi:hypothetical protein
MKKKEIFLFIMIPLLYYSCNNKEKVDSNSIVFIEQSCELIKKQNNLIVEFANNNYDSHLLNKTHSYQSEIDSIITLIKNEKANSDDLNSFLEKMGKYKIENIKFNSEIDYKNEIQKQSIILYFELVKNKILSFFQSLYYNQKYQFEYISPVVVVDNSNLKAKIYVAGVNDNSMYAIIDSDTIFMDENKELVYFIDTDLPRGIYEKSGKLFLLNESNYLEENGMDFSFKVQID